MTILIVVIMTISYHVHLPCWVDITIQTISDWDAKWVLQSGLPWYSWIHSRSGRCSISRYNVCIYYCIVYGCISDNGTTEYSVYCNHCNHLQNASAFLNTSRLRLGSPTIQEELHYVHVAVVGCNEQRTLSCERMAKAAGKWHQSSAGLMNWSNMRTWQKKHLSHSNRCQRLQVISNMNPYEATGICCSVLTSSRDIWRGGTWKWKLQSHAKAKLWSIRFHKRFPSNSGSEELILSHLNRKMRSLAHGLEFLAIGDWMDQTDQTSSISDF